MSNSRLRKLQLVKGAPTPAARTPGRVTHDDRGNAIWDWDIATGVLARKTVSELLTSLDTPGNLSLEPEVNADNDWSGDPYNRRIST
jgi:hypothetical protein